MSFRDRDIREINELRSRLARLEKRINQLSAGPTTGNMGNKASIKIEDTLNFQNYINQAVRTTDDVTFGDVTADNIITAGNVDGVDVSALSTTVAGKADAAHSHADAEVANDITLTNITQITNRSHTSLSDIGTNTHAQIDTHITNEPAAAIATHAAITTAHHTKYTDAEAKAAAVSDTAYASSWNGVTDVAPSKNAVYDKLENLFEGCSVYNSATQSVNNATWTYITYDTEAFDDNTLHSTVSNTSRITIQTTGRYMIVLGLRWAVNSTGFRHHALVLNHDLNTMLGYFVLPGQATYGVEVQVTAIANLTAGDYIEAAVYQTSGSALNITPETTTNRNKFSVQRIK